MTFKREFRSIFKYKGLLIILFVGPIFLTLFFGGVYLHDYVKDIPIAILDEDHSSLSHLVDSSFLKNERFEITNYPTSREEMQVLIDNGEVHMGIWIPKDFESNVTTYQSTQIMAIIDGSNNVVAGNAYAQASLIIQSISAGVEMKLIQGQGVTPQISENMALVYNVGERILFDPKMTYMNYLMISFLAVFLQQLTLSAMGSLVIRDRDYFSSGDVLKKILATITVCIVGIMPATIICMVILSKWFHVPMVGSIWTVLLMTIIFLLSLSGPALILAGLTNDRVKYSQFSFMLSVPTFVSSGCVWPVDQMPKLMEIILRMFWPLINYAKIAQEVLIKGMDFMTVLPHMFEMVLYCIVWLTIGVTVYNKTQCNDHLIELQQY
jgi:ABC-2 type transport system permease protein